MTKREEFEAAAAQRILIKDGPYGTAIQQAGLTPEDYAAGTDLAQEQKGNNDLVNLTQPQVIRRICDSYIDAGAHILATNTFNANRISQADYGAEHLVHEINVAAARIIREAVDARNDGIPRFVAGAVGPTNKTLSLSPDVEDPGFREVTFDEIVAVYVEQCRALVAGGLRVLEVTLRTPAALDAISAMREVDGAIVGAGTVTNQQELADAIAAGSEFIVSPGLTEPLGKAAIREDIPFLPGVATAGDVMRGLDLGLTHFKFFPAMAAGGLPALKALAAPFGQCRFCPTGGITLANAPEWLAFDPVLCVGGSWVAPRGPVDETNVSHLAREAADLSR